MWVYLVGNTDLRWFKIGITGELDKRIDAIQNGVPFSIIRLGSWKVHPSGARCVEQDTFARFSSKHLRGEWFKDLDIAEVAEFISRETKKYA